MMIILFSFLLGLSASAAPECTDAGKIYKVCANQELLYEAALAKAKAAGRPLIVVIGAEWCPWCVSLHKELNASEAVQKNYAVVDIALYQAKEKLPTGIAVQEKLVSQAKKPSKMEGIPFMAVVNPANSKVALINTEPLEKNTKITKGHDPKKLMAALAKALRQVK